MKEFYIEPTQEAGAKLFSQGIEGEVVMLNLLRFRETADYSNHPNLAPESPITGEQAYQRYMQHTARFLTEHGGELIFMGTANSYFIGPSDEQWDFVMLVKQRSLQDFLAFASNTEYLAGIGHREAAIIDSRLLPIEPR